MFFLSDWSQKNSQKMLFLPDLIKTETASSLQSRFWKLWGIGYILPLIYITKRWISEPSRLAQFNVVVVRVTLYPRHKTDGLTLTLASWLIGIFLNYFSQYKYAFVQKKKQRISRGCWVARLSLLHHCFLEYGPVRGEITDISGKFSY